MPEGHTTHGGGTRRAQPRRALATVVGIVVLLIAALAFANRGGGPSAGADGTDTGSGTTGGSSGSGGAHGSGTAPTAPTGQKPVDGKSGAGIPAGFAHTDQGAQSAAANFAVALGSADMFVADRRHRIVGSIYDPAVSAGLQGDLDQAYSGQALKNLGLTADGAAPAGFTFVSRTVPIGTKVTANPAGAGAASADAKTVEVWCTDLVGLAGTGSTKPVSTAWFTITEQLVWSGGDWKIRSSSQKDGPAPVAADNQAASADEIAGAVRDYGGFTYAR
ncbi:hypothetical protein SAMN05216499_12215 [Actinacidiphila paucisporea]|uniref:Uncharacterized protein n=2 Tax=Actinacidiphila paucisporea TaxID=310782 RepID=A0A1M7PA31_9ACTN|nr:hypothetical protein SAMN05216499_12215 [Actinacidiphila paucisporea]